MGAIGVELRICLFAASRECDVTGKLEVIAWSIGLVPRNALVLTGLATWPSVRSERPDACEIGGSNGTRTRDLLRDRQAF
jgi:hypothetical protein